MTSVLVTGASGFVGPPTLIELVRGGDEVHAICTRPSVPEAPGVTWHRIDLGDALAVDGLMAELRPQRLVHLAWYVEHGRFWDAPENVLWVERSLNLMRAFARAGGRRAVLIGTCAEYDWSMAGGPLHETRSAIAPTTLYGVAKDALRRVACAYGEREGFSLAWGRLFFLYGPREAPERLIPTVIQSLLAGEVLQTTTGSQRRDFMHVDDVARGIVELLDSPVAGPVNIASGEELTVAEIVERIALEVGRPELVRRGALPDRAGEPPLLLADVGRLRDEVGFRPRVSLADGIAGSVEWWRQGIPSVVSR